MSLCVIDIGNTNVKIAFFKEDRFEESRSISSGASLKELLIPFFQSKSIEKAFIASVQQETENTIKEILSGLSIPAVMLDSTRLTLTLDVDEPKAVGQDRIANCYGALHHFPTFDCIIVDIGTAVTFDFVTKEGSYLGGAIYPGIDISAKALASYTSKLPLVQVLKPESALSRTTETHIQSGIYYGLLGAIERIVSELRLTSLSPSSVKVLATGGATRIENTTMCEDKVLFVEDLKDLVDFIDPHLTVVGLYEIFKEQLSKKQEK